MTNRAAMGILIDLDLAKQLNIVLSGISWWAGTVQFMSVEGLEGKSNTYRHDFESFSTYFHKWYMCIEYNHYDIEEKAGKPDGSRKLPTRLVD